MAVAFTAEHADAMLLTAMYLALGRSLHISVSKLGTLTMYRALVQVGTLQLYNFAYSAGC